MNSTDRTPSISMMGWDANRLLGEKDEKFFVCFYLFITLSNSEDCVQQRSITAKLFTLEMALMCLNMGRFVVVFVCLALSLNQHREYGENMVKWRGMMHQAR